MPIWYAVYTHPREEHIADENLCRQGFTTYWPRYRRRVSHARKVRDVMMSLFPRYLFVAFDPATIGWRSIRSTRGVVDLIRNGHEPIPVGTRLIEDMRQREDANGCIVLGRQVELAKGQPITIRGDAFKGHELIFESMKDNDRVIALLSLLGREFRVELPLDSVTPARVA